MAQSASNQRAKLRELIEILDDSDSNRSVDSLSDDSIRDMPERVKHPEKILC
jgi:hypothetical protein